MCSSRDDFIPVLKTGMKSSRDEHIFAPNHVNTVWDPLNLQQLDENLELSKEQTYEAALISCRSRSEERLSLNFAHGFWICISPE